MSEAATNVVTFGSYTINAEVFKKYNQMAIGDLREANSLKEEAKKFETTFKETVESMHLTTKIPKKEITAFFKARFEEILAKEAAEDGDKVGTKAVVERGQLFSILNSTLENA